jgi:hypothetical protein
VSNPQSSFCRMSSSSVSASFYAKTGTTLSPRYAP